MILKTIILVIITVISAYTDLKENKIRNKYLLPALVLGLVIAFIDNRFNGLIDSLKGVAIPFAILFIPYLLKLIGAGDVKLYCVIGAIMGYKFLVNNLFYTILTAGVFAVILLVFSKKTIQTIRKIILYIITTITFKSFEEYKPMENMKKIPLAVPIFIGTIIQLIIKYNFYSF